MDGMGRPSANNEEAAERHSQPGPRRAQVDLSWPPADPAAPSAPLRLRGSDPTSASMDGVSTRDTVSRLTTAAGNSTKTAQESKNAENIAFVLVPTFFLLGLLGVLICHILKRKGYRCTTEAEGEDEVLEKEKEQDLESTAGLNDTFNDTNNDTVGQIVHYIMKNEANSDALKAMIHENSIDSDGVPLPSPLESPTTPNTPLSPEAPLGAPKHTCNHLHTVGGVSGHKSICSRCNQKKWPQVRQSNRTRGDRRSHTGEVTVLAVGRFRVTKCDPKALREKRTLLISDSGGSTPTSPTALEPKSRTVSSSQVRGSQTPCSTLTGEYTHTHTYCIKPEERARVLRGSQR
ncbi:RELT-like protein 1 [Arapaima gigas]